MKKIFLIALLAFMLNIALKLFINFLPIESAFFAKAMYFGSFEKSSNIDIKYVSSRLVHFNSVAITNLSIKGRQLELYIDNADVRFNPMKFFILQCPVSFKLYGVRISKADSGGSKVASILPVGEKIKNVDSQIIFYLDKIVLKDLKAVSENIGISAAGSFRRKKLDFKIKFDIFGPAKLPDGLLGYASKDASKSFSLDVSIKGTPEYPSVQISNDNIRFEMSYEDQ